MLLTLTQNPSAVDKPLAIDTSGLELCKYYIDGVPRNRTQCYNARVKIFEMSEKKTREKLLYQNMMKYIVERSYRAEAEKEWKRTIRRKAGDFVVKDGQLYYLYTTGEDGRRWVFDEEDQKRVTEACHDDKLCIAHSVCKHQ